MVSPSSFPGIKRPGREADHSPPHIAEITNMLIFTSTPPHIFMLWYLSTGVNVPFHVSAKQQTIKMAGSTARRSNNADIKARQATQFHPPPILTMCFSLIHLIISCHLDLGPACGQTFSPQKLLYPILTTCPNHSSLTDFTILSILGDLYKSWSPSLCLRRVGWVCESIS